MQGDAIQAVDVASALGEIGGNPPGEEFSVMTDQPEAFPFCLCRSTAPRIARDRPAG